MLAARAARADTPGAPDDALVPLLDQALAVRTPHGFSLEGLEGTVYLDGFAMPMFYRDGHSALAIGGGEPVLVEDAAANDLDGSRIDATTPNELTGAELSTRQARVALGVHRDERVKAGAVLRLSVAALERAYLVPTPRQLAYDAPPLAGDLAAAVRLHHSDHLDIDLHVLELGEGDHHWLDRTETADHHVERMHGAARLNLLARYHDGPWELRLDRSVAVEAIRFDRGLAQHARGGALRFESRDEIHRKYEEAHGLRDIEWITGLETHISEFKRDVVGAAEPRENVGRAGEVPLDEVSHAFDATVWRPDLALSTGVKAELATRVHAYAGVRVDSFAGDAAFGPRGELAVGCGHVTCRLTAAAYRRPPEEGEELEHPELHPERTTRIALSADHARGELRLYYADQTRLIVRDPLGRYANTGNGTTYGAYGLVRGHLGRWLAQLAVRLEHAERQDAPRLLVRPYEYDQPVRLEARAERELGGWHFAARFELREGLPYTEVAGAAYDSDRDVYVPSFANLYAERLPWQHQLDLRVDRTYTFGSNRLVVFLDIANVYDHRPAVGWVYNFDFTQRQAIQALPFWPTLGVRGEL